MRKTLIWIVSIVLVFMLYNVDAFYGQWKFNQLCQKEGGPRIYSKIERNVGWLVEENWSDYSYQGPFGFGNVSFVRWQNKKGEKFDIRIKPKPWPQRPEYIFSAVDETKLVRYKYRYTSVRIPDDERISKTQQEIIDLTTDQLVASYAEFGYQWTKSERVILNAPTAVVCWGGETREMQQEYYVRALQ